MEDFNKLDIPEIDAWLTFNKRMEVFKQRLDEDKLKEIFGKETPLVGIYYNKCNQDLDKFISWLNETQRNMLLINIYLTDI